MESQIETPRLGKNGTKLSSNEVYKYFPLSLTYVNKRCLLLEMADSCARMSTVGLSPSTFPGARSLSAEVCGTTRLTWDFVSYVHSRILHLIYAQCRKQSCLMFSHIIRVFLGSVSGSMLLVLWIFLLLFWFDCLSSGSFPPYHVKFSSYAGNWKHFLNVLETDLWRPTVEFCCSAGQN